MLLRECDIVIAGESATLALAEIAMGLAIGSAVAQLRFEVGPLPEYTEPLSLYLKGKGNMTVYRLLGRKSDLNMATRIA